MTLASRAAKVDKAAMIIRYCGYVRTETIHVTPWKEVLGSL